MEESEHLRKTLEHYRQQRQAKLDEARRLETIIRQLEEDLGQASTVAEGEIDEEETGGSPLLIGPAGNVWKAASVRVDEFFGMSQSEAAKAYLRKVRRAVTFDELLKGIRSGGVAVGGVDPKKTLYVSLARNPKGEFKFPQTNYVGLAEFYARKDSGT
jgi:hypothetical protein